MAIPRLVYFTAFMLVLVLLVSARAVAEPQKTEQDYLIFGFLPIVSPERLVKRFAPLTEYLSQQLGTEIRMETAPDFATFIQRTHGQRYDILFTAPHLYYLAHKQSGYRAVVRVDRPGMQAIIVAPRTQNIATIEDLRGRSLATTDPLALTTVLVRAHLEEAGINPDKDLTLVSTPSHNASLLSAYQEVTNAAALIMPLYLRASPEIRESMVIVAKTRMVPHMPISVSPGVDDAMAERISQALIALRESPKGRSLLTHLAWPGFAPAREDEYTSLDWITEQLKVQ
ncbi:hypothetical protein MNBD_GAMMA15-1380 [hydrothermal vent metagenome]|uniref:ABC transporter, substrate-binding protein (Cluster 12, methionine/phosphonates) n=1 Tax=hydrothermal vent metagenome TaxID=652676 RepID=A0A3B0ZG36_9ZZZZ